MKKTGLTLLIILLASLQVSAQVVGGGELIYVPAEAPANVVFSHSKHVQDFNVECAGCHYGVFEMAQGTYRMDMGSMAEGKFCGFCHNGDKSFDVKDERNCNKCHN